MEEQRQTDRNSKQTSNYKPNQQRGQPNMNNNQSEGSRKRQKNNNRGGRKEFSRYNDQSRLMNQQQYNKPPNPPLPPELERDTNVNSGWTPPPELQARVIEMDKFSYTLFFPLELTNKDYMRRILEIVALGVRSQVVWITKQRRLPKIEGQHSGDVYYLLKQILGLNRGEGDGSMDTLTIQSHFLDALQVTNKQKLLVAAEFILKARNQLFHLQPDISRLTDVEALFQAAGDLLECFGTSGAKALKQLKSLHLQHDMHCSFKEQRMIDFGWFQQEEEEEQTLEGEGAFDDDLEEEEEEEFETDGIISKKTPIAPSTSFAKAIAATNTTAGVLAVITQARDVDRILSSWLTAEFSVHTKLMSTVLHLSKDLEIIRNLAAKNQQYDEAIVITDIIKDLMNDVLPPDTLIPVEALLPALTIKDIQQQQPTNRIQQLIGMVKQIEQFVAVVKNQELSCSKKLQFQEAQQLHTLADELTKKKDQLKGQFEKTYSLDASDYISLEQFLCDLNPAIRRLKQSQNQLPRYSVQSERLFDNVRQHLLFLPICAIDILQGEESSLLSIFSLTCLSNQNSILTHWLSSKWLNASPRDVDNLLRNPFTHPKRLLTILQLFSKKLTFKDVGFPLALFPKDPRLYSLLTKQDGRAQFTSNCYSLSDLTSAGWKIEHTAPDADPKDLLEVFSLKELKNSGRFSIKEIYSLWCTYNKNIAFTSFGYTIQELCSANFFTSQQIWSLYPRTPQTWREMRAAGYDLDFLIRLAISQSSSSLKDLITKANPLPNEILGVLNCMESSHVLYILHMYSDTITLKDLVDVNFDFQRHLPIENLLSKSSSTNDKIPEPLAAQFIVQEFDRLNMKIDSFEAYYLLYGFGFTFDELLNRNYSLKKLVSLSSLPKESLPRRMHYSIPMLKNNYGFTIKEILFWYDCKTEEKKLEISSRGSEPARSKMISYIDPDGKPVRLWETKSFTGFHLFGSEHPIARGLLKAGFSKADVDNTLCTFR